MEVRHQDGGQTDMDENDHTKQYDRRLREVVG